MFTSAWTAIHAVIAAAASVTNMSRLLDAMRNPAKTSAANRASTPSAPTRPSSSPMIA